MWMAIIFATSCTVISSQQLTQAVTTRGPVHLTQAQFTSFWDRYWWVFVKGDHACEYALLTFLLIKPLKSNLPRVALFALAFAASDEFHQTFIPHRGGRWTDVAIDCIGITLVCLLARVRRAEAFPSTQTTSSGRSLAGPQTPGPAR